MIPHELEGYDYQPRRYTEMPQRSLSSPPKQICINSRSNTSINYMKDSDQGLIKLNKMYEDCQTYEDWPPLYDYPSPSPQTYLASAEKQNENMGKKKFTFEDSLIPFNEILSNNFINFHEKNFFCHKNFFCEKIFFHPIIGRNKIFS